MVRKRQATGRGARHRPRRNAPPQRHLCHRDGQAKAIELNEKEAEI